jgi:hypothetical protein
MISQFPREGGIQSSNRAEMRSTPAWAGSWVMPNMITAERGKKNNL